MSEFSKAQKALNAIDESILEATRTGILTRSSLMEGQQSIDSKLLPIALKYEAKLLEKDVVSGEPRLGPQMREKVQKFKAQLEALSADIAAKLAGKKHNKHIYIIFRFALHLTSSYVNFSWNDFASRCGF